MYTPPGYFGWDLIPETRFELKLYSRYGPLIVWAHIHSLYVC